MRTKRPVTVTIALILIFINALFWLGLAALYALNVGESIPKNESGDWRPVILYLGFAILWVTLAIFLTRRSKIAHYVAVAIFILGAALTIPEKFSPAPWQFLIFTIIPLVLLITSKRWFLPRPIER